MVRLIATGAPKSGTTALTILIETGFGIPRSRGALGQRAGVGDVWITLDEGVCDGKLVRPLAEGLAQMKEGEMMQAHIAPRPELDGYKVIAILRDPRDNVVSWFRAKRGNEPPNAKRRQALRRFVERDQRLMPWIKSMRRWQRHPNALVVQYDSLFAPETVARIAAFLDRPTINADHLYGTGPTWSGAPSDWREWFDAGTVQLFESKWKHV